MIINSEISDRNKETGETLHDKLSVMGGPLILETLKQIEAGTAPRTPQDDSLSCYAHMLDKELGCIDWNKDAAAIERLIRGLNSWPSAYTFWNEKTLKIWDSEVVEYNGEEENGTVIAKDKLSFTVKCGENALKILEVQLQGKKRMATQAFLVGNQVETGMRLG